MIADCFFVMELREQQGGFFNAEGEPNYLPAAAMFFVVYPFIVNLVVTLLVIQKEFIRVEVRAHVLFLIVRVVNEERLVWIIGST